MSTMQENDQERHDRGRRERPFHRCSIISSNQQQTSIIAHPEKKFAFIHPPKQRQRWGDEQVLPHVDWGDLFFDLFYVGAAYNLGSILVYSPTKEGFLYFIGCFGPIMSFWYDKVTYDARFAEDDDVVHSMFEVIQLCVLATAVLHIRPVEILSNPSDNVDMFALCLALLIGSVMTIFRYVEILIWVVGEPAAKHDAWRMIKMTSAKTVFFLAATIVASVEFYQKNDDDDSRRFLAANNNSDIPIWLLIAGWLSSRLFLAVKHLFFSPGGGEHKKYMVPMHIDFTIHRFGEWTMLMLGESVLSLLIVDVPGQSPEYYVTFYAGILSVVLLQYLHFRSQPHHAENHALRRDKINGLCFTYLMEAYSAALIIVGVSYKLLVTEHALIYNDQRSLRRIASSQSLSNLSTEDRQQRTAHFFCGAMAVTWLCLDLMILTHHGLKFNSVKFESKEKTNQMKIRGVILVSLRVGLVLFIATLSLYVQKPVPIAFIGLVGIIAQVVLRVLGDTVFPDDMVGCDGKFGISNDIIGNNDRHEEAGPPSISRLISLEGALQE